MKHEEYVNESAFMIYLYNKKSKLEERTYN
jgi:hypothetical protein